MRAVEKMATVIDQAAERVREGGWIAALVGREIDATDAEEFRIPESEHRRLVIRQIVPRGTIT
jgi:hypothetical protein